MKKVDKNISADDLRDAIIDAAMQHQVDNATVFSRDRTKSVGASETYRCIRSIRYTKDKLKLAEHKNTKNPKGGFMLRGSVMEDVFMAPVVQALLGDDGHNLGDDQITVKSDEQGGFLTATIDGRFNRDWLLEFKTFDPRNTLTEPKYEHVLQTHIQMHVTKIKTHTFLVYFNASDWFDIRVWKIDYDEEIALRALDRAEAVMNKDAEHLAPEGQIKGDCQWCEFRPVCEGTIGFKDFLDEKKKNVDTKTNKQYVQKVSGDQDAVGLADEYLILKKQALRIKKDLDRAEIELKLHLMENSKDDIVAQQGSVAISYPDPKSVLDRDALIEYVEEHGAKDFDINDFYIVKNDKPKPRLTARYN